MPQPKSRHANFPVPYGTQLLAKGWRQEGLLRLLENVLSVGEDPDNLVIYAALGKAARNWQSHHAMQTDTILAVADWMTVMAEGRVLAEGTPDTIRANTAVQDAYLGGHA